MRLTCPRCDAEYEIDDQLIPANGREVECSACDNVWFQPGRLRMPAPLTRLALTTDAPQSDAVADRNAAETGDGGQDLPPPPAMAAAPARKPPEDVMAVLRDEAAHFRASHPGIVTGDVDTAGVGVGVGTGAATPKAPPQPQTATASAADAPDRRHAEATPGAAAPEPAPASGAIANAALTAASAPGDAKHAAPRPEPPPAADRRATQAAPATLTAQPAPARRGFGAGFLIGLAIAAVLAGLYVAAPHAGEGALGDALRTLRAAGDGLHHWVQGQLDTWR